MSNYTKQISWSGKDALSDSDPEKVISGGDFDTEFSAVQTAINSKIDGGTITNFTSTGIDDNATSTAITIDASENVGIGTGSPDCKLDVRKSGTTAAQGDTDLFIGDSGAASSTAQVQILGGASGFSNLYFSDTGSYNVGGFIYNHTDNYLATNVNGAERMRIDSSGNVEVKTGNLVIGTSGKGIDFSAATPDGTGSTGSEVLDDYEEGTWTPTAVGGFTGFTINSANYTKIGRSVTVNAYVNAMAGASANTIAVGGLPFTSIGGNSYHTGVLDTSTSYVGVARVTTGSTNINFYKTDSTNSQYLGTQNTGHMIFSLTYQTS